MNEWMNEVTLFGWADEDTLNDGHNPMKGHHNPFLRKRKRGILSAQHKLFAIDKAFSKPSVQTLIITVMSEGQTFKTSWWDLNWTCNTWFVSLACSEAGTLHTKRSAEVISVIPQDMISLDSHDEVFYINHRHGALNRELAERAESRWEHVDVSDCMTANQNKSLRTAQAWLAHMAARLGLPVVDTVWQSTGQPSDAPAFTVSPDGRKSQLSASSVLYTAKRPHSSAGITETQTPTAPAVAYLQVNTHCQNICGT